MLKSHLDKKNIEIGCDEAGRGCLAGPVVAAAVILPKKYKNKLLNDSKKLSLKMRDQLRVEIERDAIDYGVGFVDHREIDQINILNASFLAMHRAMDKIIKPFDFILVDGNRFKQYKQFYHQCIVKGDSKYLSIAAASILAKTYRDEYMDELQLQLPRYDWLNNKGYPTQKHREAIRQFGPSEYHRMTFQLLPEDEKENV
jgi:ribonuclease HII